MDKSEHDACVDKWVDACAVHTLDAQQALALFEQALGVLLDRARQTLGDVTLIAILDRVLFTSSETFPLLAVLKVEGHGLRWDELRERVRHGGELREGMRFVLVEFLTVL